MSRNHKKQTAHKRQAKRIRQSTTQATEAAKQQPTDRKHNTATIQQHSDDRHVEGKDKTNNGDEDAT